MCIRRSAHRWRSALASALISGPGCAGCAAPAQDLSPRRTHAAIFTLAYETLSAEQSTSAAPNSDRSDCHSPSPSAIVTTTPTRRLVRARRLRQRRVRVGRDRSRRSAAWPPGAASLRPGCCKTTARAHWTTAYQISFVGGDRMSGADTALVALVPSGGQSDVSVQLAAPTTAGTYTGQWQMRNAAAGNRSAM